MKKLAILFLLMSTSCFAQNQISLKDLGTMNFDKVYNELQGINESQVHLKFQNKKIR